MQYKKRRKVAMLELETRHWSHLDVLAQGYATVRHERKY